MTSVDHIARDGDEEGQDPLGPMAWLMPLVVLFQTLFLVFTNFRANLTEQRRARRFPKDWQSHYANLREAEWPIAWILAEGARQLLSGQELDLRALPARGYAPDWFMPPMPRSALAMHLRIEAAMRFNAEPERYTRRHAERIAAHAAALRYGLVAPEEWPVFVPPRPTASISAPLVAERIRVPP